MRTRSRRGFALLVSVLVFSTILLTVAAAAAFGLAGIEQRGLELQNLLRAQSLAEGCADAAIMSLRLDNAYAGNQTLTIGGAPCTVQPIVVGSPTLLETQATVNTSVYRLKIQISDIPTMKITSWQRVSGF